MQSFDGYNLFGKDYAALAANVSLGIYGANNAKEIEKLRAAGGTYPLVQYWNGNGCEHGDMANLPLPLVLDPTKKFKSNNIVGIQGGAELVRLLTDKRDWFVQYDDGRLVESVGRWAGNIYFDLSNTELQAYWLAQLDRHMLAGASGVFLDNKSARGFTAMSGNLITTATYGAGDSLKFFDAQLNWFRITHDYLAASGKKLYANISQTHVNPDYFKALCRHVDGVMFEQAFSSNTLASDLDLITYATSHNVECLIVCGVEPHETTEIERMTACYKLIECPLTRIRYSKDDAYSKWWLPDYARYAEQLVTPNSFLQKQAEISTRRFYGGYAFVNTKTREYGIELQKPMPVQPKPWENPTPYKTIEIPLLNQGVEVRVTKDGELIGVMQLTT